MFILLHPAALLALTGLLVPVAIHLFNRRPGREVAVGSLRWLAAGANRRLRHLKLEQLGLLLLRAALLALLAVAGAGPVWRTARPASRGVVLLSPEAAHLPGLPDLKPTIDSLRGKGYVLRWLAADFPMVPVSDWRALAAGRLGAAADSVAARQPAGRAWARVQQAAAAFPGQPLLVVSSAALTHLGGTRLPVAAAVRWLSLPDTAKTAWLATAELVGDSLQVLVGRSSESRTTYQRGKVRYPRNGLPFRVPGLPPLYLRPNKDPKAGFLVAGSSAPAAGPGMRVDVVPLAIDIYAAPEFAADARYLEAALRAAGTALALPPRLRRLAARPAHLTADWVFWLSAEPLPPDWQAGVAINGRNLWREAPGPGVADTARLASSEPGAPVAVFRRSTTGPEPDGETLWADGRGHAILSRQAWGRGATYQLHTRLNPAWSELADDPQLPAHLLELLQPDHSSDPAMPQTRLARLEAAHDRRALDPAQLTAVPAPTTQPFRGTGPAPVRFYQTDLRPWLVLLAALLLLIERLLAHRQAGPILPVAP